MSLRPSILKGSTAGDMEGRNPGEERAFESVSGHFNTLMNLERLPILASQYLDRHGSGWLGVLTVKGTGFYSHAVLFLTVLRIYSQQRSPARGSFVQNKWYMAQEDHWQMPTVYCRVEA